MTEHLSDEDLERIQRFASRPRYKRTPDELLPGEDEE
jgi:hypothetical protein